MSLLRNSLLFLFGSSLFSSVRSNDDLSGSTADAPSDSSDVTNLNAKNFDEFVHKHPLTLVEFFAPWCGHCKALAPHYAKAATTLKGTAELGAVDCTVEKDLCSQYEVQGFPTLKIFRNDGSEPAEYGGGRTEQEIITYMRKQNEPAFVVIDTEKGVAEFIEKDGIAIVGFFDNPESENAKVFIDTAKQLRNEYNFAILKNVDLFSKYGIAKLDTVAVVKDNSFDTPDTNADDAKADSSPPVGDVEVVTHSGDITLDALKLFISTEAFPLVGDIGPENFQKYLERGFPLVWMFIDLQAEKTGSYIKEMTTAAKEFKGKLSIVKLDGIKWAEHAKHFGIPSGHLPGIVAEDREEGKNYVYDVKKDVTSPNLIEYLQAFVDGKLTATLKSQEPPEKNDDPVKVVVGKTFDELVLNNDKDVFVEFYAPWCGHCKSLAPKWEDLGKEFKDNDKVVIAKVDATENDTPAKIQGFPTLILYPSGDKSNPIQYEGERTTIAMSNWLKQNGKTFGSAEPTTASSAPAGAETTASTEDTHPSTGHDAEL